MEIVLDTIYNALDEFATVICLEQFVFHFFQQESLKRTNMKVKRPGLYDSNIAVTSSELSCIFKVRKGKLQNARLILNNNND